MAQQLFNCDINLNGNQLLAAKLEVLAADPAGGNLYQGRVWFNSSSGLVKYYDGTTVIAIGAAVVSVTAGDGTITIGGTGTAPTVRVAAASLDHTYINDFDTQVRTSRLSQMAVPTADVSFNGNKLTNLAAPIAGTDATNKTYVDNLVNGAEFQTAVRAVATSNQASLSGLLTIDGVTLTDGDRVLLTGQATGSQNGPWVAHAGAWTRPTDYPSGGTIPTNRAYFVQQGTAWADTGWTLTNDVPITVDTTGTVWTQFTGLGEVTAGTGLTKSGNTMSLIAPVVVGNGGTGASTAAGARANLGTPGLYAVNVPATNPATITHALGTTDVIVQVQELTGTKRIIGCEVDITDANTVTLSFNVAPTAGQYRCVVHG
jgi:hypothetical protein